MNALKQLFSRRSRTGQSSSQKRRFSIEPLEQKRLLSGDGLTVVSPDFVGPLTQDQVREPIVCFASEVQAPVVANFAIPELPVAEAQPQVYGPQLPTDRLVKAMNPSSFGGQSWWRPQPPPQGIVVSDFVHGWEIHPSMWHGDIDVTLAEERAISADPNANAVLTEMVYPAQYGTTFDAIESVALNADLMDWEGNWGQEDGYHETTIATGEIRDGHIVFDVSFAIPQQRGLSLEVEAIIDPEAGDQEFGVAEPMVTMMNGYQRMTVMQFGPDNPTYTIDRLEADLSLDMTGTSEARVGDTVPYSFTVTNNGPDEYVDYDVLMPVPAGTVFNESASSFGVQLEDGVVHSGWVGPTGTFAFDITDDVDQVVAQATVTSLADDPDLGNNTATVVTDIVSDPTTLDIGMNDISTETFKLGDNNVVIASLTLDADNGKADVTNLYFMIGLQDAAGQGVYGEQFQYVYDVEIRNTETGRTINAQTLTGAQDAGRSDEWNWQTYTLRNFIVGERPQDWEIRFDVADDGQWEDGMRIRTWVSTQSEGIHDFGGVLPFYTDAYNTSAVSLDTGESIEVFPGGVAASNVQVFENPQLIVVQKTLNAFDTAVENAKDINLLRFEAEGEVLLTKAQFTAVQGDLDNVYNYTLWVDTDGDRTVDTVLEDDVVNQAGWLAFSELIGGGFMTPAVFEVHGDVAPSLTADPRLQLGFATGITYLEAEEFDDGTPLTGINTNGEGPENSQIIVTTTPSTDWSFVPQGNLWVTKDSTPVMQRQVLGGELSESLLRLQFRAEYEDIDVTYVGIDVEGDAGSIDVLELWHEDAIGPFALATRSGAMPGDDFGAVMENEQCVVPEGEDFDVPVRARIKSDVNGGISGDRFALAVDQVFARGAESSNDLLQNDADGLVEGEVFVGTSSATESNASIIGRENTVVMSKITSITNANPDPHGSAIFTGVQPFFQVSFTAPDNVNSWAGFNDVVLDGLIVSVNATNVEIAQGSFMFYNKADSTTRIPCTVYSVGSDTPDTGYHTGALLVDCRGLASSLVDTRIDPGERLTFVLEADIVRTNIAANATSTLQGQLQRFNDPSRSVYGVTADDTGSHIRWLDADSDVDGTFTWVEYPDSSISSTSYRS